jgi:hypothetical protein
MRSHSAAEGGAAPGCCAPHGACQRHPPTRTVQWDNHWIHVAKLQLQSTREHLNDHCATIPNVTLSEGVKMQKLLVSTMETKSFYPFVITNL